MSAINIVQYNPGKVPQTNAEYRVEEISRIRGLYRLHIKQADGTEYITQTGGAVNTYFTLPTDVLVEKIAWTHTTADNVTLSADALAISLDVFSYNNINAAPLRWYAAAASTASSVIQGFAFHEPPNRCLLTTNTTLADRIHFIMDITVSGDPQ